MTARDRCRGTEADSRRLFVAETPASSFGARVTAALDADYVDRLGQVSVPTLILTPSHDVLIGEGAAKVLREGIPAAREIEAGLYDTIDAAGVQYDLDQVVGFLRTFVVDLPAGQALARRTSA
jgi:pimeloyl-ACP methyl ester carboxylesterase